PRWGTTPWYCATTLLNGERWEHRSSPRESARIVTKSVSLGDLATCSGKPAGDLAAVAHQRGGVGDRELPPHRGAVERQLAKAGVLRAHLSEHRKPSGRGSLRDRLKRWPTRQAGWGKVGAAPAGAIHRPPESRVATRDP